MECTFVNNFIFHSFSTFSLQKVVRRQLFAITYDVAGLKKELGAIVVGTQIAAVVSLCLWEIWAFDESVVTREQKLVLNWMYIPFLLVSVIMVVDMLGRVNRRVQVAEAIKKKA